jgi:ubiquinone/menaquinone biosynthesis C-methylase UbiE
VTAVPIGNHYDKYATKNPIARRLMEGFMRAFDDALPNAVPSTVLEIGVGEGEIADRVHARYPDATVVGLDLPDPALAQEWQARSLRGVFCDAGSVPVRDASIDLVLAIEVLEHLPDPGAALRELARVARGDVVVSVPREPLWRVLNLARGSYIRDLGNTPGHIQHWSAASFRALVQEHFDVVSIAQPLPWTVVRARTRIR